MDVGLIILIVTLLAFLAMAIFVIVKLVKGPDIPKGLKFEAKESDNKAVVVVSENAEGAIKNPKGEVVSWLVDGKFIYGADLAKACARAIHATELAFLEKGVQKADVDRVVFYFQTDDEFEGVGKSASWWQAWSKGAAAYSTKIAGIFGFQQLPMAVIRTKYLDDVHDRGQPAIHELVHILNEAANGDYSHNHTDPKLWLGPGGVESAEGIGVQKWKELTGTPDGKN